VQTNLQILLMKSAEMFHVNDRVERNELRTQHALYG
jgi:hypothetical protein